MADYPVAKTEIGVWEKTLLADTQDSVEFARDCEQVRVVNVDGAAALYFTTDGSDVTVGAPDAYWLPAIAGSSRVVTVTGGGATVVNVKAAGTPVYSVEGSL